jgi:hypothetical protein
MNKLKQALHSIGMFSSQFIPTHMVKYGADQDSGHSAAAAGGGSGEFMAT